MSPACSPPLPSGPARPPWVIPAWVLVTGLVAVLWAGALEAGRAASPAAPALDPPRPAVPAAPIPAPADPSATFFGLTNLWTIHLTLEPAAWKLLRSRGGPSARMGGPPGVIDSLVRGFFGGGNPGGAGGRGDYPWATGTLEVAGQRLTNVALRFKGASSMVRAPNTWKRPFKVDFNRGATNRTFLGIDAVYLNNNVNDATQMREALAYDLFRRAGLPAPRTAFARVYLTLPGQFEKRHLGLYTVVEAVEDRFLERAVGTRRGLLLKPEMMPGLPYFGDDWEAYPGRYAPKGKADPKDTRRLIEFVRFIEQAEEAEFTRDLPRYLEPEPFARFVALNALLANTDSFLGNGHNYYLHLHPATGRSTFIPWDLNEAFGMHPVSGPSAEQLRFSVLRPNADPNALVERFVGDPVFGPLYRAQCAALLTNLFRPDRLAADIDRIASVTRPVVLAESRRAREDFERTVLQTRRPDEGDTSQPRYDEEFAGEGYEPKGFPPSVDVDNLPLKDWIAGRAAHVQGQLDGRVRGTRPRARAW